jgi:HEAT repeat protein
MAATASAQPRSTAADSTAAALGRGWSAVGQGQPAKAIEIASQLLQGDPTNHDAVGLAAAAHAAAQRPVQALDVYERWLQASGSEDIFLLRTVATATLRLLAAGPDPRVRIAALAALASAGDSQARAALADAASGSVEADAALASLGDAQAVARLEAAVTAGGPRDKSAAIDALRAAGSKASATAIASALKDPAPPSRMAAATALAELGATEAIPALKAVLKDPDPSVRYMVEVALARLGDSSAGVTLESLANSPIGEMRLLAASAAAEEAPQGPWSEAAQSLLRDADPLVRLRAAALLVRHGRESEAAEAVLAAGLADPSPAVRSEAANLVSGTIQRTGGFEDLPALRRMLRDQLPDIQAAGASGLLRRVR